MAIHAPITERREFLALIGQSPFSPVIVETRPASFADALAQYRRLCGDRSAIHPVDGASEAASDVAESAVMESLDGLLEAPARSVLDVNEKLAALSREYAHGDVPVEHLIPVMADLIRLGGVA